MSARWPSGCWPPLPAGDHAVVLGASMAGLAAARVLADAYRQVTVVDRDLLPAPGVQRRGVSQGRHAHGLLARGREVLEELFCGLTDELVARGALYGDVQLQGRWYNEGVRLCQAPSGLNSLAVSRPLLEGQVRRLAALPGVRVVDDQDVAGWWSPRTAAASAGCARSAGPSAAWPRHSPPTCTSPPGGIRSWAARSCAWST